MSTKILLYPVLLVVSLNAAASSTWVDNRYAHITGSEKNQYKIGGGHTFDNGATVLAAWLYDAGKNFDQFKSSFQEYEGWYPVNLSPDWTLSPGLLSDVDQAGTKIAPYAMLEYRVSGDLSVAGRYRYNHMTHKDVNINGEMEYNDSHLLDVFVNYQATDKLWLQLTPEFSMNAGDFRSPNGKRTHWEPNIAAHYQLNKHWRPFVELGWLDRDENHDNQVRVRIGIRYFLP